MATTDYSLERGLPASIDAERSILGAILLESLLFDQAAELKPDDFSLDAHRRIFSRMRDLQDVGRPVDMITLAEGVETSEQFELLAHMGCDQSQGYLHSRPLPAADLEPFLIKAGNGMATLHKCHVANLERTAATNVG